MEDYHALFLDAVQRFIQTYQSGGLRLLTEADMKAYLFHYCLQALEATQVSMPYLVYCDVPIFSPRERADLLLGDNEVVVELKLEPDYPGLHPTQKPRVFSDDIERDFERVRSYCQRGIPHGYVLVLDEDGCHLRAFPNAAWQRINDGQRDVYLLVRHFQAGAV